MHSRAPLNRSVLPGVVLATVLASGCTVTVTGGDDGPAHTVGISHSVLQNGTVTLNLHQHPSRADFGMNATSSFAGYGSTSDPVRAVIELPSGDLTFPRTDLTAATNDEGGAGDTDPSHQPKFFTATVDYPDRTTARADALGRIAAMRLTPAQVDDALHNTSGLYDVSGRPDDWRSTRLSFTSDSDGSLEGFYSFDLDVFHNAAIDRIKHQNTVDLDLRTPPSRAALGFLPGYALATVPPDPGQALTLELETPNGHGQLELSSPSAVDSDSPTSAAEPNVTTAVLCDEPEVVRDRMVLVAHVLGLDRAAVARLPIGRSAHALRQQLSGRTTAFRTTLRFDPATTDAAPDACARILLDYPG